MVFVSKTNLTKFIVAIKWQNYGETKSLILKKSNYNCDPGNIILLLKRKSFCTLTKSVSQQKRKTT